MTLATLSNGLTVIVQENHVAPVATVRCSVKNTGSAYEGKHLGAGISHVLEHVVAGGSTTHRSEKEIERLINTFGGATNAFTSTDMTTFFIDCPAKNTVEAIGLLADEMQHAKFVPAEFERELKVVRRELADDEVSRSHVLWTMLQQTVYTVHPARHPVIGYLEVLNRTTNQTIIDFYHERYVPNNQVFVVVGDVKTQDVLAAVAARFAATPRSYETYVAMESEPEQLAPREAVREMDGKTYDMAFAWPTVKLSRSRDVRAGRGGIHSRRRRKLAARATPEVRQAISLVGQLRERHAELRERLFRRAGEQPAGDLAAGRGGNPARSLPPARGTGGRGGAVEGEEAKGVGGSLCAANGAKRRQRAGTRLSHRRRSAV